MFDTCACDIPSNAASSVWVIPEERMSEMSDLYIDRDYQDSVYESQQFPVCNQYQNVCMTTLAERLTSERERKNLTQEQLAKRAGCGQSTIGNLESGNQKTTKHLPSIATAIGVEALWLAEGRGPKYRDAEKNRRAEVPNQIVPDSLQSAAKHNDSKIQRMIEIMETLNDADKAMLLGIAISESRHLKTTESKANKAA